MIRDLDGLKDQVFSRRAFFILCCKLGVAVILVVRLFFLQISKFSQYKTLSDKNRIKLLLLEPFRGSIKDRNDVSIAENQNNYKVYFYKQRHVPYEETLAQIFSLLRMSREFQEEILKKVANSSYVYPILVKDNMNWDQIALIEGNQYQLPGVYVDKGYVRHYPYKEVFTHVVGYMGVPRRDELQRYSLYNAQGFKIGKTGIESLANGELIGKFGSKKVEVNAARVVVREFAANKSERGSDVKLTFDARLQKFVYDSLPKDGATATVMDIKTGEVLAMVSTPSFDANIFSNKTMDKNTWDHIVKNKSHLFTNRSIAKLYPPGSIWKIVVALAILEHGISPNDHVNCNGHFQLGNHTYRCWKNSGHGVVDLNLAIMQSCNVYFYEMSLKVGIAAIYKIAHELGFGDVIGLDIPGEVKGLNPNKAWKAKYYKHDWVMGDTVNSSIGQGFTSVTPIQIVTMLSRVASSRKVTPKILMSNVKEEKNETLAIKQESLNTVKQALYNVFNQPGGLGYNIRIPDAQYAIAGKSGTAQIVSRDTSFLSTKDNKAVKSHALFAGYGPFHDPKYAVVVAVDNVGWGVQNAVPIGREILYFTQKLFNS
jgi:penicillin-binding protein 2